jgi:hypothetical protein
MVVLLFVFESGDISFDKPAIVGKRTWQLAQRRMESQKARAEEIGM